MATYTKVPRNVPSLQRSTIITAVSAGDQIDIESILGRPARQIRFIATDASDVIEYKLNNYISLEQTVKVVGVQYPLQSPTPVRIWSGSPAFATFSLTGTTETISDEGLRIASIEIVSLTLNTGTTIEIEVF